ncbi:MAG: class I SAM-dependent methyltransferase, partial [Sedimentisphaerales bacterium]|nr:class I SAM-dependent methyltransferase [Sedimentisphaerales bacterium]
MSFNTNKIDIKESQLHSDEQRVVLRKLAEYAARPGCKFLEIGSWCGDSTVLLGKVAQNHGGRLYCVDWWKGNIDTELAGIAEKVDVFSFFWKKICDERLEDVIVPIRSRSDLAADILKKHMFDMVFIDADHRYEAILKDIKRYAPMVRKKHGVLCGHDCEGYVSDYDRSFLESGKDTDVYESVHCGIVLAVGSVFDNYSINHAIWSLRIEDGDWKPTSLTYPEIDDMRQTPLPPIGLSKNYVLRRYGKFVYAVPYSLDGLDLREKKERKRSEVVKAKNLDEAESLIAEKISAPTELLESYRNFDLLNFKKSIYAVKNDVLSHIDVVRMDDETLKKFRKNKSVFIGALIDEVKNLIDKSIKSGDIKISQEKMTDDEKIIELQNQLKGSDKIIQGQNKELKAKESRILELQSNISDRDSSMKDLQGQ